jgi:hypothetical protein
MIFFDKLIGIFHSYLIPLCIVIELLKYFSRFRSHISERLLLR